MTTRTEPDFVSLATDLSALHGCASNLGTAVSSQINSMRAVLERTRHDGDHGLATQVLSSLEHSLRQASEDRDSLDAMAKALDRLRNQGGQIDRLARFLRASISSFAVESVRSPSCQQAFGTFVDELRMLSNKLTTLGEAITSQAGSTHQKLTQITSKLSSDLSQISMLASHARTTVKQTSEAISTLLDSSWEVIRLVDSGVQQIGRHASEAVYHLQFGDIVRQKLEHVVSSIEDAGHILSSGDKAEWPKVGHVLEIQAAQLEIIAKEIESARAELSQAFNGLSEQAEQLVQNLGQMGGKLGDQQAGKNPFEQLKSDFEQLSLWQKQSLELSGRAHDMSTEASNDGQQLSVHLGQLQDINREMHMQALNAIVKTAWLREEGVTLGVLSMHIHQVFLESNSLVNETVEVLESMINLTCGSFNTSPADAASQAPADTLAVCGFPAAFQEISATSARLVKQQDENLVQARERLEFLTRFVGEVRSVMEECQTLRQQFAPADQVPHPAENLAALDQRYTMESERQVHRQIRQASLAGAATAAASPQNPPANQELIEAIPPTGQDSGFEDFGAPSPEPSTSPPPAAAPAPASQPAAKTAGSADDNIEFF